MEEKKVKKIVKEGYAQIARQGSCSCNPASSCCGSPGLAQEISKQIGYTETELNQVPKGAQFIGGAGEGGGSELDGHANGLTKKGALRYRDLPADATAPGDSAQTNAGIRSES